MVSPEFPQLISGKFILYENMEGLDQFVLRFPVEFKLYRQVFIAKQCAIGSKDIQLGNIIRQGLARIGQKVHEKPQVMGSGIADTRKGKQGLEQFFRSLLAMKPEDFVAHLPGG